jgi:signal transduction histidine kinase
MSDISIAPRLQDHAAYLEGSHDFQADIDRLVSSDTVGVILETVMLVTNMRFAAVARVTADRWVACRTVDEVNFGLASGDEIEIDSTFCRTVRETSDRVLFEDSATDEVYGNHPIARKFGIASYASIPIFRKDGSFFGTLCAIDTEPRRIRQPRIVAMFDLFADIIGRSLETEEELSAQKRLVEKERALTAAQEEFIAILGHDLRNPVAAFGAGLKMLGREPLPDKARELLPLMRSALLRMDDLIENILLHARARFGTLQVDPTSDAPLAAALAQVVDEVRAAEPQREITLAMDFAGPVACDAKRVAQAVANLLSNAVQHGDAEAPVQLRAQGGGDGLSIAVSNRGGPIPSELQRELFKPFERGAHSRGEGLGLGLHIAASIARAHGGTIDVSSTEAETTFTLRLPSGP